MNDRLESVIESNRPRCFPITDGNETKGRPSGWQLYESDSGSDVPMQGFFVPVPSCSESPCSSN